MSNDIKVEAGEKREFSTGAEKQAAGGKGTPVLVPGDAIMAVAKHFEKGAAIYGGRNWEKGIPLSEILNSLERHLQQEKMGMTDEPHADAMAWNALVYLATKLRVERGLLPSELNDMPVYDQKDRDYAEELKEFKDRPVERPLKGWSKNCGVLGCNTGALYYCRPLKMSMCRNHYEKRGD